MGFVEETQETTGHALHNGFLPSIGWPKGIYKNRKTCPVRYEKWPNPVVDVWEILTTLASNAPKAKGVDDEPHLEEIALFERPRRSEVGEASSYIA